MLLFKQVPKFLGTASGCMGEAWVQSLGGEKHRAFGIHGGFDMKFFSSLSLYVKKGSFKHYLGIKAVYHAPDPRSTPAVPCQPKLREIVPMPETQGNKKLKVSPVIRLWPSKVKL